MRKRLLCLAGSGIIAGQLWLSPAFAQDKSTQESVALMMAALKSNNPNSQLAGLGLAGTTANLSTTQALQGMRELLRLSETIKTTAAQQLYIEAVQNLTISVLVGRESDIFMDARFGVLIQDLELLLKPVLKVEDPIIQKKLAVLYNKISLTLIDSTYTLYQLAKLDDLSGEVKEEPKDPEGKLEPEVWAARQTLLRIVGWRKTAPEALEKILLLASQQLQQPDKSTKMLALQTIQNLAFFIIKGVPKPDDLDVGRANAQLDTFANVKAYEPSLTGFSNQLVNLSKMMDESDPELLKQICLSIEQIGTARRQLNASRLAVRDLSEKFKVSTSDPIGPGFKFVLPALSRLSKSSDASTRLAAIEALEPFGKSAWPGRSIVNNLASDSSVFVRWVAARSLRELIMDDAPFEEKKECYHALSKLCADEDLDVRITALGTARLLKPTNSGIDASILQSCTRGDVDAREEALITLPAANVNFETALPVLKACLKDSAVRVRLAAAKSFQDYGPKAIAGIEELKEALIDTDENVRKLAAVALATITK